MYRNSDLTKTIYDRLFTTRENLMYFLSEQSLYFDDIME